MREKKYKQTLEALTLAYIESVGGLSNIEQVEACSTRLRLVLKDKLRINVERMKAIGAKGILERDQTEIHIVIGVEAAEIANEVSNLINLKS